MPPALVVLADDPAHGVPGVTADPSAATALLTATLDVARRVAGVSGRVLLFHPADAEARLTARALGFRLWPQDGDSPGRRYANAFAQATDLGYDGAVVIGLTVPTMPADRITEAASLLDDHHGAVICDGRGGIALLALQEPHRTLFTDDDVPSCDELRTRAAQQRIGLVDLEPHPALTAETVDDYLSGVGTSS